MKSGKGLSAAAEEVFSPRRAAPPLPKDPEPGAVLYQAVVEKVMTEMVTTGAGREGKVVRVGKEVEDDSEEEDFKDAIEEAEEDGAEAGEDADADAGADAAIPNFTDLLVHA